MNSIKKPTKLPECVTLVIFPMSSPDIHLAELPPELCAELRAALRPLVVRPAVTGVINVEVTDDKAQGTKIHGFLALLAFLLSTFPPRHLTNRNYPNP